MRSNLSDVIAMSSCRVTDGTKSVLARDIWQSDSQIRARLGRSLVLACVENDLDGLKVYMSLAYGDSVAVFFPSGANPATLNPFIKEFEPEFVVLKLDPSEPLAGFVFVQAWGRYSIWAPVRPPAHRFVEGLALLATTSGSTGSPKVVRQSAENILINTQQIVRSLDLSSQDTAITSLPLSYTFGQSTVNCQILTGGKLVVSPLAITQVQTLKLIVSEDVNVLSGVPQTYQQLVQLRFFKSRYAAKITKFLQAGGKMPTPLEEKIRTLVADTGKDFFVMYGQAEATTRMSALPARAFLEIRGSAGAAMYGGKFTITGPDKEERPAYSEGEIVYEGPNVTLGYAETAEDLQKPDSFNGILRTGDVGFLDERGFIYITGRLKRFAKINGQSVNLAYIEALLTTELAAEFTCVELNNKIYAATTSAIEEDRFEAVLSELTVLGSRDFELYRLEALPQTATGKVDHIKLLEEIQLQARNSLSN